MPLYPIYKIEDYSAGDVLKNTITSDAEIMIKEILNENVGTFNFVVPAKIGTVAKYNDIALFDKVKFWLGYDSVSGDPNFIGRVYQITAPLSTKKGYIRMISGRCQGEILQRRLKGMVDYEDEDASDIITELAEDLSLGTDEIEVDETPETHRIDIDKHERYINFLRKVSDYYYDAGTQVKKDFRVDVDGNLVWKSRPIRTAGVETFTVGTDVVAYNILYDLTPVRNKIMVYGAKQKKYNDDDDFGTDMTTPYHGAVVDQQSASGQKNLYVDDTTSFFGGANIFVYSSANVEENVVDSIVAGDHLVCENNLAHTYGVNSDVILFPGWGPTTDASETTITSDAGTKRVGSRSIKLSRGDGGASVAMLYKPSTPLNFNYFPSHNFYIQMDDAHSGFVRLTDNASHYAENTFNCIEDDGKFHFVSLCCGRDYANNWDLDSGFDWTNVYAVEFWVWDGTINIWVDGQFLNHRRFSATAEDATSQSNYGIHEMAVYDEALMTDGDCAKRGESLLYQLKNPVTRVDLEVEGNMNVLLGDRLTLTFPEENNMTDVSCDVVGVTHSITKALGFRTIANMVTTADLRRLPPRTRDEFLTQKFADQRDINRGLMGVNY